MGDYYKNTISLLLAKTDGNRKERSIKTKNIIKTGRKLRYVNDATFKHRPPLLLLCAKSESKQYRQYQVCNNIFNIFDSLIYFRCDLLQMYQ